MTAGTVVLALAGGSLIFVLFMVVFFFAIVWGFYTRRGSGIDHHPNDGLDGAPGSEGPSSAVGKGRSTGDTSQGSVGDTFSKHGTG